MRHAAVLILLAAGLAAQEEEKPKKEMGLTGVLSEEEFKALHELTDKERPPPRGKMIDLGGSKAYLSLPEKGEAPLPAIVVIHEWWGLNQHVKYWADRLAADGYAALAVDLYGGKVADNRDDALAYMKAVKEDEAKAILKKAHAFLGTDPRIQATKRGCIGWCFGGGWSLQQALQTPDLDAAVIYYGRLVTDVDALKAIHAPLLCIFGNLDTGIPPAAVDEFEAALKKADRKATILRYDANHAFANPSGGRYDEKAAEDAWKHVRAFLAEHLKEKAPQTDR